VRDLLSSSLPATNPPHFFSESIVNEAPDAGALAVAIRPALGLLLAPMMKLVGHVVGQTGVSVQGTTVTVSSQQVILTVNGFATVCVRLLVALASLLTRPLAPHQLLGQGLRYGRRGIPRDQDDHSSSYVYVQRSCLLDWHYLWLYYLPPQSRPQNSRPLGHQIGGVCCIQSQPLG